MRAPDDKHAAIYKSTDRAELGRLAKLLGHDAYQRHASRLPGVPPLTLIEMLECSALLIREVDNVLSRMPKPTPKQRARLLCGRLAAIKKFQRSFGADEDDVFIRSPEFEKQQALHKRLHDALTDVRESTRGELEDLPKAASYSHENAGRPELNAFQAHALKLWRQMGGTEASRSLTVNFVYACTHPIFPETTKRSIGSWFDRYNQLAPQTTLHF